VQPEPLHLDEVVGFVADPSAGGICTFSGTVRDHSAQGAVTGLTYEAWTDEAERRLRAIADEAASRWALCGVAIVHRFGNLGVGESSVVIAVSSAHRAEAFEACRHVIERLKQDVPIWKKESLTSGEAHWVMGS
jgi:molybdopterin synthase catalytic subunit